MLDQRRRQSVLSLGSSGIRYYLMDWLVQWFLAILFPDLVTGSSLFSKILLVICMLSFVSFCFERWLGAETPLSGAGGTGLWRTLVVDPCK